MKQPFLSINCTHFLQQCRRSVFLIVFSIWLMIGQLAFTGTVHAVDAYGKPHTTQLVLSDTTLHMADEYDSSYTFDPAINTFCNTVTQIPQIECQALVDFYHSTNGQNWERSAGWNITDEPCSWRGVSCSGNVVIDLVLEQNRLNGSIPESLGNLTNLRKLILNHNQLSGSLPKSLGYLSNLRLLHLMSNQICGEISTSLMNPSRLGYLQLQNNHLSASDPEFIEWLNVKNPEWATTQTPCPCFVYAVHDDKLNNSQLFTIDPTQNFQVNALGDIHQVYDLEGLDFHPQTLILYASSGDNPAQGLPAGYLYQVNYDLAK